MLVDPLPSPLAKGGLTTLPPPYPPSINFNKNLTPLYKEGTPPPPSPLVKNALGGGGAIFDPLQNVKLKKNLKGGGG
jgi:hypothetical protein